MGEVLRGVLLDEKSNPLVDWYVCVIRPGEDGHWLRSMATGSDGVFSIPNIPGGEKAIEVRLPSPFTAGPIRILEGFFPSGDYLRIVIRDEELPSARIRGTVVDVEDRPVDGATNVVVDEKHRFDLIAIPDIETHAFQFGPLVPGTYRLEARGPGFVPTSVGGIDLAPNESADVGPIRLTRGGRIEIELISSDPDLVKGTVWAGIRPTADGESESLQIVNGRGHTRDLPAGSYIVEVGSHRIAFDEWPAEVLGGEQTRLAILVEPATSRRIRLDTVLDLETDPLEVEVLDPQGNPIHNGIAVLSPGYV